MDEEDGGVGVSFEGRDGIGVWTRTDENQLVRGWEELGLSLSEAAKGDIGSVKDIAVDCVE